MIQRRNTINSCSSVVTITISYSKADIKQWARLLVRQASGENGLLSDEARKLAFTEIDYNRWAINCPEMFYSIEQPWSGQLARWAFSQSLKLGYLVEVEGKPGHYRLTDKALKLK